MFCENEHDRKTLQKIISNFEKKTLSICNNNNNNKNNNNNSNNNNNNPDKNQTMTFLWIPKIEPKI